ncbi:hypothetical protein D9M68_19170 [compost metagenome]
MKDNNVAPLTLLGHAIVFVSSNEQAIAVMEKNSNVKEFFLIAGSEMSKKPAGLLNKNVQIFRIRPSGSWNTLWRAMANVDIERGKNEGAYASSGDLMFISILTPHDISCGLNRHRAVNQLSCREMHWLDTLELPDDCAAIETLDLAMRSMPSVPAPVAYSRLSIQQRFDLTAFEFARFTRPIHCVKSVDRMYRNEPFYTDHEFGITYKTAGYPVNVGTAGHKDQPALEKVG